MDRTAQMFKERTLPEWHRSIRAEFFDGELLYSQCTTKDDFRRFYKKEGKEPVCHSDCTLFYDTFSDTNRKLHPWVEKALSYENKKENAKLALLGRNVIKLYISEKAFRENPNSNEGALDYARKLLDNTSVYGAIGRFLGLGAEPRGWPVDQVNSDGVMKERLFSVVGASYQTLGLEKTNQFVDSFITEYVARSRITDSIMDLYKLVGEDNRKAITFEHTVHGDQIKPFFESSLRIAEIQVSIGFGATLKKAERDAAATAVKILSEDPLLKERVFKRLRLSRPGRKAA